jgi:hypothetical protein
MARILVVIAALHARATGAMTLDEFPPGQEMGVGLVAQFSAEEGRRLDRPMIGVQRQG